MAEVELELAEPSIWENPSQAQELGQKRSSLLNIVGVIDELEIGISDAEDLLELVIEANDSEVLKSVDTEIANLCEILEQLEFRRMFSGEMDDNNAFLDIQSGSGGTEAQDWAEMLLRMYLRWGESMGFKVDLIEASAGDVAGIKSATIHLQGQFTYGWLRTETGVHRLVRKSPFDSGSRRHTSFASVFVSPEINDDISVNIDPSDVRTDTYRASGAGGQHVNKTDSAVRLTHLPTNTVAQCQSERSQHQNRDKAWKMLTAKLYELEIQQRNSAKQELEDSKSDIGWGSQIRSYVLDDQRIKDLRTGIQTSNCQQVLDGDINLFIEASLKQGL